MKAKWLATRLSTNAQEAADQAAKRVSTTDSSNLAPLSSLLSWPDHQHQSPRILSEDSQEQVLVHSEIEGITIMNSIYESTFPPLKYGL